MPWTCVRRSFNNCVFGSFFVNGLRRKSWKSKSKKQIHRTLPTKENGCFGCLSFSSIECFTLLPKTFVLYWCIIQCIKSPSRTLHFCASSAKWPISWTSVLTLNILHILPSLKCTFVRYRPSCPFLAYTGYLLVTIMSYIMLHMVIMACLINLFHDNVNMYMANMCVIADYNTKSQNLSFLKINVILSFLSKIYSSVFRSTCTFILSYRYCFSFRFSFHVTCHMSVVW